SAETARRPAGTFVTVKRPSLSLKNTVGLSAPRDGNGAGGPGVIGPDLTVMRALRIASPVSADTTRPVMVPVVSILSGGVSRAGACAKPRTARAHRSARNTRYIVRANRSAVDRGTV